MNQIIISLQSLVEISRRLPTSFLKRLFRRNRSLFVYVSVAYNDFLDNTQLFKRCEIIEFEKVMNELISDDDKKKINNCLNLIYDENQKTKEPYKSIVISLFKKIVNNFLDINTDKRPIIFLVKDYRIYDLLKFKKSIYFPSDDVIYKDIGNISIDDKYKTVVTLLNIKDKFEKKKMTFKTITELDNMIFDTLKLKNSKIAKSHII